MMKRLTAAVLTFLLLGCGAYVFAATGGDPTGGGNAAVTQYEVKTPETPTYQTTAPKQESENKARNPGKSGVGGEERGDRNNGDGARPETRLTSAPVETAATGPSGGATGLPFTGLELLALVMAGLLLIGLGVLPRALRKSR